MNVVVTGGAGFIGGNLCRVLAAHPAVTRVVAFDDLSTGFADNLRDVADVSLVVGSILDEAALRRVTRGVDAIVHLAARPSVPLSIADPEATNRVNVTGTLAVLEAARAANTYVVVASSSAVYGDSPISPKDEEMTPRPLSPYGVSKVATEQYANAYLHSFALPTLALRFFNVYGPLQPAGHAYAAVVPAFISAAIERRPLPVFGDGNQVRDFVFVDTVADVLTTAVVRKVVSPTPVNLASGTATDLNELIQTLEKFFDYPLGVEYLPARAGDILVSTADQQALRSHFPDCVPADLAAGLARTVEWFRTRRHPRDGMRLPQGPVIEKNTPRSPGVPKAGRPEDAVVVIGDQ
jgi:UDP-glucose 4-epimerase